MTLYFYAVILFLLIAFLASALKILREYERGVVFMLGRFWRVKGPGLIIIPVIQQFVRVDLRTIVLDVPSQDVISRDNVSVKVNAVVYFRVLDPERARRAKVIHAQGEQQAAEKLVEAARILSEQPQAIQLRYLETLTEVAGDKSHTLVFPLPMDLLEPLLKRKERD
ncbi:MAG: hypothetical protein JAY98_15500 [Candidatus Thiodiazotropha lotti]|nr:hypothetical protein [Candidatus Thiodiazotropha lotti]MCW4184598.1 SPFH domain-containing protein [Candidatus Thiodiazotropha weberae]